MLKILMLNYEFPPLGGGAGTACLYLLKELSKYKNIQVDLVTSSTDKYKLKKFSKNINIYFLDINKNNKNLHFQTKKDILTYILKSYIFSKKLIKKNTYNLVHAFFTLPSGFVAFLLKKPYIVSLRGSDVPFFNPRFHLFDRIFFTRINRVIWKKAAFVTANSIDLKNLALSTSPKQKIKIIFNAVDTNFFKPIKTIKKEKVILYTGRLIKRKGIKYLIKAFCKLNKKLQKKWQVWIVGEGPKKTRLEILRRVCKNPENIKFLGIKNKQELLKIYNQASIFVLPSINEGMSNSLLEAMACGLPIITTKTGGYNTLISQKNGIIIDPKNSPQFKKALERLCSLNKKRLQMGHSSLKKAQKMSLVKMAKSYIKIYYETKSGKF